MTNALPPIAKIAELLGGEASGNQVRAPGPGHSAGDRSLSILLDASAPDGFVVHSFAGDDGIACKDYVRERLRLQPFEAKKKKTNGKGNGKWSAPSAEYVYCDAHGEPYLLVRKHLDANGKKQFPQFHWDGNGWAKGKPDGPKILYRLPELIEAPITATIYFVEGEKDADTLAKIGFVATTASEGAAAKWDSGLTPYFKDRHVVILPDADLPGRAHAKKVAKALHAVAASVRILDLNPERQDGSDVSNFIAHDTAGVRLAKLVTEADEWEPSGPATSTDDAKPDEEESEISIEISRLAKLPVIKYEQERKAAAEALSLRASILDQLVQAERARIGDDDGDGRRLQGRAVELPEPEPSEDPVDGAILLDEIVKAVKKYIVLSAHAARSCAVWTVYTFLAEHFLVSPRLCISSPVMGCGKSTLTDIVSRLVLRPLKASNATAAAIFRVVEMHKPCLLIDEGDTFVELSEELRGILNSGHRHDGAVLRVVGEDLEPRLFATFSPCSVALIGELPPTLADRSILIDLKRRRPADGDVTSFSLDEVGHLDLLARQSTRWAEDHAVEIAATKPEMPNGIINRARDNWRVLKAIATVVGGPWPGYIDAAALAAQARTGGETSWLEQLLADIKAVAFVAEKDGDKEKEEVASAVLVECLVALEGRPWAEMGKNDKPLTQNRLAKLLKPVGIGPDNIGPKGARVRGYKRQHFDEAFERYLGVSKVHTCTQRDEIRTSDISEVHTMDDGCAVGKSKKPNNDGLVGGCAVEKGDTGGKREVCAHCGRPGGLVEVFYSGRPMVRLHRECKGAYRKFLDEGEKDRTDSVEEAPEDRTCAQCNGEIDGTERLVSVSGRAAWLHLNCERFWVRALNERER